MQEVLFIQTLPHTTRHPMQWSHSKLHTQYVAGPEAPSRVCQKTSSELQPMCTSWQTCSRTL